MTKIQRYASTWVKRALTSALAISALATGPACADLDAGDRGGARLEDETDDEWYGRSAPFDGGAPEDFYAHDVGGGTPPQDVGGGTPPQDDGADDEGLSWSIDAGVPDFYNSYDVGVGAEDPNACPAACLGLPMWQELVLDPAAGPIDSCDYTEYGSTWALEIVGEGGYATAFLDTNGSGTCTSWSAMTGEQTVNLTFQQANACTGRMYQQIDALGPACGEDPPECGNGILEAGEACDGADLNGASCGDQGWSGTLTCTPICTHNWGSCDIPPEPWCGDWVVEGTEQCDGGNFNGQSCASLGLGEGSLGCTWSCAFDTSACIAEDPNACPAACLGLPMWQELVLDPAAGPIDSCDYTEYGSTWSLEIVGEGGYATAHLDTNGSGTCTSWSAMTGEQTVNLSFQQANACTGRMYQQIDALGPACGEDPPQCGNGILEAGEACDGADLNGASCGDQGWSGTLTCSPICTHNWGSCDIPPEPWCGDWAVEGTEQCDNGNFNGQSCASLGLGEGSLGCTGACAFDTSACVAVDPNACPAACLGLPMWQELVLDPAAGPIDSCDFTEYGSTWSLEIVGEGGYATAFLDTNGSGTCTSWSAMTGEQIVNLTFQQANACTGRMYQQIDALGPACGEDPPECGNGILEAGEACDGSDLNGASCGDQGWSGTLTCSPICTHNWGSCDIPPEPWCGDWVVEGTEQCDGGNLNGQSCASLGLGEGNLGCTGSCAFDTSSCIGEDPNACPAACLGLPMWQELVLDPAAGPIDSCDYTEYGSTYSLEIVGEGGYATSFRDTNSGSGTCTSWTPMTGEQTVHLSYQQANSCTMRMYQQIDALGPACGEDPPQCGNGILEAGEACDGADLNGASCGDQGWSGTLTCTPICTHNWGSCDIPPEPWCGDWLVEGTEQCDGGNFSGQSCASLGLGEGNLGCTGSCAFDTSACVAVDPNACPAACLGLPMWQELVLDPAAGPIDSCDFTEYGSTWSLEIVGEGGYATAHLDTNGSGTCTSWTPMTGEQTVNLTFQQANACTGRMYQQIDALGPACGEDPPQCGNGILEAGEACDGADLNGASCGDQGWSGTLTCSPICTHNWGSCDIPPEPWCGDWLVEGTEQCDGGNFSGQSCASLGLGEGNLGCTGSCAFDTSACIPEDPNACPAACLGLPMWQELVLDPAAGPIDSCDYTEYGSTYSLEIVGEGGYATAHLDTNGSGTCTSWSPMTGEQTVNLTFQQANACTGRMYQQIDALGPACGEDPPQCGNGILEAGEACDGADLNGASCGDQGWSGTLTCSPICTHNWGSCDIPPEPWCGDWLVEGTEQCDGGNFSGQSCASLGLGEGNLGCTGSCAFDTSACIPEDPNACPAACLGLPMWQELVLDPAAGPIDSCDFTEYGSTWSLEIVGEGGYATAHLDTNGSGTCTSWSAMTGEQTVNLTFQQANACTGRMYQQIDALGPACGEDPPQCGNGILEAGEACDGADLNGASCGDQGWSGTLTCSPICTHNWGSCDIPPEPWCGDWLVEGTEQCDGGNLSGQSCASLGLGEGNLGCTWSCAFDTSSCIAEDPNACPAACLGLPMWQELVLDPAAGPIDSCDFTEYGSTWSLEIVGEGGYATAHLDTNGSGTCTSWSAMTGEQTVNLTFQQANACTGRMYQQIDALGPACGEDPPQCGNGILEAGEACDGSDLNGASCGDQGWSGTLTCSPICTHNWGSCDIPPEPWCGDWAVEGTEQCDGGNLNGQSCASLGLGEGNLGCTWSCAFDTSSCIAEDPNACPAACLGLPMWQELVLDPAAGPIDSCDYTEYGSTWSLEIVGEGGYATAHLDTNGSGTCTSWSAMTGEQTVNLTFQQANACTGRMYQQIDALGPACGEDPPQCGNGILEAGEACDGSDLNGASCGDQGWSGTLTCSPICTHNWGSCDIPPEPWCGDWVVEGTEQCDGGNLNGHSCGSLGLGEGSLGCTWSCAFDTSSCMGEDPNACPAACLGLPMWQELVLDPAAGPIDSCDYTEYGSTYSLEIVGEGGYATSFRDTNSGSGTCTSWTPMTGEQTVNLSYQQANSCTMRMYQQIDALGPACGEDPPQCGNGILEAGEACDGADLNGASCGDQGWSGTLTCSPFCTLDWGSCDIPPEAWCGDWMVEGTEQCDGGNLNGHSCGSLGLGEGNLGCTGSCGFDTSSCIAAASCGNEVVEGSEQCDGSDFAGNDCGSLGFGYGMLACTASCTVETWGCVPLGWSGAGPGDPASCGNPGGGPLAWTNGTGIPGGFYCYEDDDSTEELAYKACESHFGSGNCCVITGGYQDQQYGSCASDGSTGSIHWHWDNHPEGHCEPNYVVGDVVAPGWCGTTVGNFLPAGEDPSACPAACLGLPMWQELVLDPAAGPIDSCDYTEYGSTWSLEIVGDEGYAAADLDTNSGSGTCTSWSPMTGEQTVELTFQQANSCTTRMYMQIDALGPDCAA